MVTITAATTMQKTKAKINKWIVLKDKVEDNDKDTGKDRDSIEDTGNDKDDNSKNRFT